MGVNTGMKRILHAVSALAIAGGATLTSANATKGAYAGDCRVPRIMNFKKVRATVGTTAAPDKRRQFREMGGADGLNDSNSSPATTFPVPKDRAAIRAGLLLREINPDRDRNENCSGYNQSAEDIFHLARPCIGSLKHCPKLRCLFWGEEDRGQK